MAEEKKERIAALVCFTLFAGAVLVHYLLGPWSFYRAVPENEGNLRRLAVQTAEGWLGYREADGSHEAIIDLYNSHEPLAEGYSVTYSDSWCAAFVSAVSIQLGLTEILPTECSCGRQIELFQALGQWQEDDDYVPQPGDLIYYDWDMTQRGSCTGWPDHVGIVVGTKWPFVKVIEGNKDDSVSYRVILLGHKSIRGYGLVDYAWKAAQTQNNTP